MTTSDLLFTRPSFLEGVARILDFGNTLQEYNTSISPEMADYRALMADWQAVGEDMMRAVEMIELEMRDVDDEQKS
jgi:hypothetical protein